MSISVIIPTLNAAACLPPSLHVLAQGAVEGIIREVIIADGGSEDDTQLIAQSVGAKFCRTQAGRGQQLAAGAEHARSDWLLFLHADTVLGDEWISEVRRFIHQNHLDGNKQNGMRAGVFKLKFDERGIAPSIVAWGAMFRTRYLRMPYGDQGLLISKRLYEKIGGFRDMVLFEDVDIIKRIKLVQGRKALHVFHSSAITSAKRYREDGYMKRVIRNFCCIVMYRFGIPPVRVLSFYQGQKL